MPLSWVATREEFVISGLQHQTFAIVIQGVFENKIPGLIWSRSNIILNISKQMVENQQNQIYTQH